MVDWMVVEWLTELKVGWVVYGVRFSEVYWS